MPEESNAPVEAPVAETPVAETPKTETPTPEAPKVETPAPEALKASSEKPNFFAVLLNGVLKPMTTFKEQLPKFTDFKNAAIISLIVVAAATILSTITTVVGIVRTEECVENCSRYSSLFSSDDSKKEKKMETKWDWGNLEKAKFDWFKNVGQTFLMNAVVLMALSGAYFGISKAFKSQTANYGRMMTVVAVGMVPVTIVGFLAPIIGMISTLFSGILFLASAFYSFAIIFVGLNEESGVEGDKKIYLNVAALACMVLVYYIIIRFMLGEIGGKMFESFIKSFGGGGVDLTALAGGSSSSLKLDDLLDL